MILLCPAIPTTNVAKIKGATNDFIKFKNIFPKRAISKEIVGKSIPNSTPKIIAANIHKDIFLPLYDKKNNIEIAIYLRTINTIELIFGSLYSKKNKKPINI